MYARKISGWIRTLAVVAFSCAIGLQAPLVLAQSDSAEDKSRPVAEKPAENKGADVATKSTADAKADSSTAAVAAAGPPSALKAVDAVDSGTGVVQIQQKDQNQSAITQPLQLSPEVPNTRVGVDPNQKLLLTMQDAVTMALQRNLDIEVFRQGVQIAQSGLVATYGAYDVISSATFGYRGAISPSSNVFTQGGLTGSVTNNTLTYNFLSYQEVEKTGGRWQVSLNNSRFSTNSRSNQFQVQYNPQATFNYTQPLLRDLSFDQNRRAIRIAKKQLDLSDSAFRQRVIEIISNVQSAYWDLVFAIQNEKIARDSVELARVQLDNNRKMVEAGTLAPIELRSTEAALESRKGDVILALQGITTSENALKGLLFGDPNDKQWFAIIDPTDKPQTAAPSYTVDDAVNLAVKNRPELEQTKLQIEQKDIDIRFFKSQLKPQLDLGFTYLHTGQAGTANPSAQVPPPPEQIGGYSKALTSLFSGDFRTYEVALTITLPWKNRAAEGNYGSAVAQSRQLDARYRQLVQSIQIEVRNALQAVEAARLRLAAQRANVLASDAQYKGELERFRAGLQTNFFVLQRQTELSQAQGAELRALTDYNKALSDLQRVTGLTLVSNNVQVPSTSSGDQTKKDNKD